MNEYTNRLSVGYFGMVSECSEDGKQRTSRQEEIKAKNMTMEQRFHVPSFKAATIGIID